MNLAYVKIRKKSTLFNVISPAEVFVRSLLDWQRIQANVINLMHSNRPIMITVQLYGGADCYACCRFLILPLLLPTAIFSLLLIYLKFINYHVNEFYVFFFTLSHQRTCTYIYRNSLSVTFLSSVCSWMQFFASKIITSLTHEIQRWAAQRLRKRDCPSNSTVFFWLSHTNNIPPGDGDST